MIALRSPVIALAIMIGLALFGIGYCASSASALLFQIAGGLLLFGVPYQMIFGDRPQRELRDLWRARWGGPAMPFCRAARHAARGLFRSVRCERDCHGARCPSRSEGIGHQLGTICLCGCFGILVRMGQIMASNKQFAALPFRIRGSDLDVLLITTRRKRRWSLPKGWPIAPGKPRRTAEIEAFEEAGLIGKIKAKAVGRYKNRKLKGKRKVVCDIRVFPLEVRKQKKRWPERDERDAIWLPARKAAARVHKVELGRLIERFARRKSLKLKPGRGGKSHRPSSVDKSGSVPEGRR